MSNNVILTEPADRRKRFDESHNKRLKYLMKENTQLKDQVKDLQNLLQLNREALQVMSQINSGKGKEHRFSEISKSGQETYSTMISRGDDIPVENPLRGSLVSLLMQENKKLAERLDQVIEERNTAQNRAYLNERIIQQNLEFEEEMALEYKEKIENLKVNIRTKEYILHEMECLRMVPASNSEIDSRTYILYKEVAAPFKAVNTLLHDKKMLENELVEERVANSKIRKDYKALFDKATVGQDYSVLGYRTSKTEVCSRNKARGPNFDV
jgi:hypothetical protein